MKAMTGNNEIITTYLSMSRTKNWETNSTDPATARDDLNVSEVTSGLWTNETFKCVTLQLQGGLASNTSHSLVSAETEALVLRVRDTVILPVLFLIGGPANLINMAVFYKQTLKERINVCLFALSLADMLYLLNNIILYGEQLHIQFTTRERFGPIMRFMTNHNLLGFYGFTWVSEIISTIIASERCFCILRPLRSQTVLRTSTTTVIIVIVYIVVVSLYFLVNARFRMTCVFDPLSNRNMWIATATGEFYLQHKQFVDFLDVFVYGIGIPVVTIVVVTVTTGVTMVKLRQAAAWRAGTSSSGAVSSREIALTRMLVYNSVFFIICVFPVALFRLLWLFMPEVNPGRSQHNLFFTCLWLLDSISYVNATFNIIIYYAMGSRYRETFWQLLGRKNNIQKVSRTQLSAATS